MSITFTPEIGNKPKANGKHPLFLRITAKRKKQRISLGYEIPLSDWNPEKKEVRKSNPYYRKINDEIEAEIHKAKEKQKEAKVYSTGAIKAILKNKVSDSFFDFAGKLAEKKNYNTARGLKSEIQKFRTFVKNSNLTFEEISKDQIEDYAKYLKETLQNNPNTVGKALSKLRSIIRQAIKEGKMPIEKNPFFHIEIKHGKTDKVRLNQSQIEAIQALQLEVGSNIWHIRNYWLFAYYTAGMRFSDVATLKNEMVNSERIIYKMEKTGQQHSVKLNSKAKTILAFYQVENQNPKAFVFPILDCKKDLTTEKGLKMEISRKNALANKYLAILSQKLELPRKISFHCSRHSFADMARKKTNDIYSISKLLNHSKISITEAYLSEFDTETTDRTMDQIFD
jgi:site-specific recombinase XerD